MKYSKQTIKLLKNLQQDELNAYHIYTDLAARIKEKEPENAEILARIGKDEYSHYELFKGYTGEETKPQKGVIKRFILLSRLFGLTFALKLLERGEADISEYNEVEKEIPEIKKITEEEEKHENTLLNMLNEERLTYMGSVVLGLNDALVELTGALAGFTLSLQNSRTIALLGIITGISASLSMAASEYLSSRTDEDSNVDPKKAAIYTGIAYVFTVILLILPFLLINNYIISLIVTLVVAIFIIALFNYYISVAKDLKFFKRFLEMAVISLGVAVISFVIGYLVNRLFGLDA